MFTPQDILKIIEEIEKLYPTDSLTLWENYAAIYGSRWEELKEKFEKLRVLR